MADSIAILKMLYSKYTSIAKAPRYCKERKEDRSTAEPSSNEIVNHMNVTEDTKNKICRICLWEGSIFIFGLISTENLAEALTTIVGIEVTMNDSYPKYLCQPCHALLQGVILFRKIAQQSEKQLKNPKAIKLDPEINECFSSLDKHIDVKTEIIEQVTGNNEQLRKCQKESLPDINKHSDSTSENNNEALSENETHKPTNNIQLKTPKVKELKLELNDTDFTDDDEFVIQKSNIHSCTICLLNFNTYEEYIKHKLSHMPKMKKELCLTCNKMFTPWYLKKHIASHKAEARSQKCTGKEKMLMSYKCNRCNLQFFSHQEYNDHKQTPEHLNKKQPCAICNKTYGPTYIKKHMLAHKSEMAYICDICGKKFKRLGDFNNHNITHLEVFPFKCSLCPYKGKRNNDLKMHMRSHTGERPYQCEQCPQRFKSKSNLNMHVTRHNVERDFKCEECSKEYRTKQELSNHYKAVHVGIKEHICQYCNKVYSYRKHMMRHQLKVHKREKFRSGRMPTYLMVESVKQQE